MEKNLKGDELKTYIEKHDENLEVCPDCNLKSVRGKELWEGGGVECVNADCRYWFCY